MKKTVKVSLIIACILVIAGSIAIGAAYLMGANAEDFFNLNLGSRFTWYKKWDNEYSAENAYRVPAQDIEGLDVDWTSGEVRIELYDGEEIAFSESSNHGVSQDDALGYGVEDGILYIQYSKKHTYLFLPVKSLTIQLPREMAQGLETIRFSSASANLSLPEMNVDALEMNTASGALEGSEISVETLRFDAASGTLQFSGSAQKVQVDAGSGDVSLALKNTAQQTDISTVSGDIYICGAFEELELESVSGQIQSTADVSAQRMEVSSTSGLIALDGAVDEIDVQNVSGDVQLVLTVCPKEIKAETTSGDIALTLPQDSGLTMSFDTVSGDFDYDFPFRKQGNQYISADGSAYAQVGTVSGSLTVTGQ